MDDDSTISLSEENSYAGNAILNTPGNHSTASISHKAYISKTGSYNKITKKINHAYVDVSASLTISDCSRSITLDLPLYNKEVTKNSFSKIDTLLKEIAILRENMVKVRKEREAYRKIMNDTFKYEINKEDPKKTSLEGFIESVNQYENDNTRTNNR